ncbi:transporter [Amphritea sp. 1_MG-2023]|uniref:transporter n=1 Tax=Amphritea sp. 1_MG-2023 TaxID=3062670 RepID=UPI0026E1BD25|nr:transporter [Amphritea sp. 1_MG-2023]MDO6565019.1 transporter [Amphritea sp. 1_MG-2023]
MMNRSQMLGRSGVTVSLLALAISQVAYAAEAATASEAEQLKFEIQQLKLINEKQAETLKKMERRLSVVEQGGSVSVTAAQPKTAASTEVIKEAAPSASVDNMMEQEHALFNNDLTLEFGMNYSHYDRKELVLEGFLALDAIFLGDISVDDVSADIFTFDMTGRYNINDHWQLGVNIPLVYRETTFQRNVNSVGAEATVDEAALGDITLTSAYKLFQETATRPDIVWNLSIKTPTGSDPYGTPTITKTVNRVVNGSVTSDQVTYPEELPTGSGLWSISNSLSFVKTTDPAILFANVGYTYNIAGGFNDISSTQGNQPGDVRLGDSIFYGLGMAFALNERMSTSLSLSQRISQKSETRLKGESWEEIFGSDGNAATFNVGVTYALSDNLSMSTSLGLGLTPDAPDYSLGIKFPYRF